MTELDGRLARGEASRVAMLTAAVHIVASQGIEALTHRAVGAAIGVPHARVVYHFASAADLRQATLVEAGHRVVDRLGALMGPATDPAHVPAVAGDLAVEMVTTLRDETVALFGLLSQATRDELLRGAVGQVTASIADLIEPLSGSRALAAAAASALLGTLLVAMAEGKGVDADAIRVQTIALVERFDPNGSARADV